MIFSRPELLPLLGLPILLGCWQWWRRGRPVVLPFDHGQLRRGTWLHWLLRAADLLPAAILAIRLATPFVGPGTFPLKWWDGTKVGNALKECAKVLEERHDGDRMIIVLTDGESPDLKNGQAEIIARELLKKNIVVYIISIRN